MKMESTVVAPRSATVVDIVLAEGSLVEQDDVVIVLSPE
jgi:biotin carboxyl carrier protein